MKGNVKHAKGIFEIRYKRCRKERKSYRIKCMLCNICNTKAMCIKKQANQPKNNVCLFFIFLYIKHLDSYGIYVPTC